MTSCAFFSVAGEIGLNSELCSQMVPWNSCRIVVRSLVAGVLAIKQILVLSLFISMALRGSLKLFGLPRWFSGKESACQYQRHGFDPWVGKIPWRRKWQPTPVFLSGESHGQTCLEGYSLWSHQESDTI